MASKPSEFVVTREYADERGFKDGDLVDISTLGLSNNVTVRCVVRVAVRCPACGQRDLDKHGVCWNKYCSFRRCETCGKNTGSQFICNCSRCGLLLEEA